MTYIEHFFSVSECLSKVYWRKRVKQVNTCSHFVFMKVQTVNMFNIAYEERRYQDFKIRGPMEGKRMYWGAK